MHCALLLHIAMQIGLSHHSERSAWRLVSEDSGDCRSFLLIVRTLRFSLPLARRVLKGYSEFPAFGQVYLRNYNIGQEDLHCEDRSIVTAAVYRGFDQELRLAADPIN